MRHFKCSLCTVVKHSQKELNNHHKSKHGKLKCPDCDESFDTPSGLHRHKYRHRDKKFKCSTRGDQFPFSSQVADHQIWHTNGSRINVIMKIVIKASRMRAAYTSTN